MRVPEQYRVSTGPLASTAADGRNGLFMLPTPEADVVLQCIASDGEGWEHVSVVVARRDRHRVATSARVEYLDRFVPIGRTPTWEEMSHVRSVFWSKFVTVLQFHPPADEYVNVHETCLHLWRQGGVAAPTSPRVLVG